MIFAAIAALTLASCAKIETMNTTRELDEPAAIGFTNYAPRSLTKADGTYAASTSLIAGKKFAVYSYATANGTAWASNAIGTQFMNGVEVTYTNNENNGANNGYAPLRYWPSGDTPDWLTFWAYYPVQDNNGITYTAPTGSNGVGTYTFTAATAAADMVDFMVSDVVNDKIYGESEGGHNAVNGVVALTFRHQLTKIAIKFKTDNSDANTDIVLTGASLKNIKNSGTLTTTYANPLTTNWSANAVTDSNSDGIGDVVYAVTLSGAAISNEVLTSSPVGGADADLFLMIPQTMLANNASYAQYLEVSWQVKTYAAADAGNHASATPLSTTTNTKKLYFDDCTLYTTPDEGDPAAVDNNDWARNQFTTYTVTVGPKPIRFTATVAGWDDETTGSFNAQ